MTYYLSLGSNLGDREATIRQALQRIEQQIGPVRRCSSFYYSKPWGFESEHDFCNLCCAVETDKTPLEVLHLTQTIERALGRKEKSAISNQQSEIRNQKLEIRNYTDRCIDIDLIRVFDERGQEICLDTPELTLPHKFWQQRDFVKLPLGEIMQP